MAEIRANTVLPARREAITLETADGLTLIGELAQPEATPPIATLVMLHPLPTHGGMMGSHLFRKAALRLPALADLAVLRFNTRGTESEAGRSEGEFDNGESERYDVAAALDYVEFHDLPAPWLVGSSSQATPWARSRSTRASKASASGSATPKCRTPCSDAGRTSSGRSWSVSWRPWNHTSSHPSRTRPTRHPSASS